MKKIGLIIVTIALFVVLGIVIFKDKNNSTTIAANTSQNVEIKDGVQYITVNAKGGYWPRASLAKANTPTKLVIITNNTYDCSSALVIKSIRYFKILPITGKEVIDIGNPPAGQFLGLCSMGMYSFTIDFK